MQRKRGIPKLLTDEFLVKMEDVVIGVRMAGGVISRKMIFAIVTRVIKAISIKTEGLWRLHYTNQSLGKGCFEINGMI